jgi:hypothetical protein
LRFELQKEVVANVGVLTKGKEPRTDKAAINRIIKMVVEGSRVFV